MNEKFSDIEVIAFLDESLNPQRSAQLELALRTDDQLRRRVLEKQGQQSAGLHTIGGIWQRSKLRAPRVRNCRRSFKKPLRVKLLTIYDSI